MKNLILVIALAVSTIALPFASEAATAPGVLPASSVPDLNTQSSLTNNNPAGPWGTNLPSTTQATNGYYPPSITGGTIVTNYVWLNNPQSGSIAPGTDGNVLSIAIASACSGASMSQASGATNAQFTFFTSVAPPLFVTNPVSGSVIVSSNGPALIPFTTLTLSYNGITNTQAQSNWVYSSATTPPFNAALRLYLGTINAFVTNTAYTTNTQIYTSQN